MLQQIPKEQQHQHMLSLTMDKASIRLQQLSVEDHTTEETIKVSSIQYLDYFILKILVRLMKFILRKLAFTHFKYSF